MKHVLRLLYGITPFFLLACNYSPSGSHYRDLDPTPRPEHTINLNEQGDTLYARGTATYEFSIASAGKQVYAAELWLGDKLLHRTFNRSGSFKINTKEFAEGFHTLKLIAVLSSGTGSLADHVGQEQQQVYQTWILAIENAAPTPTRLISIKPDEGTLRLTWEPYSRRYFKNYIVYRYNKEGQQLKKVVLGPELTTWTDEHFVGGEVYYSIGVEDHEQRIAESERVLFSAPAPRLLTQEYISDHELKVTFSSARFYKNFGNYYFRIYHDNWSSVAEHEITAINDTVVTVKNVPFGVELKYVLNTSPESISPTYLGTSEEGTLQGLGEENTFVPFTRSFYNAANNLFYDFSQSNLKVIDGNTLEVLQSKNYNSTKIAMSADSRLLYLYTSSGLMQLDPLTLNVTASWQLADLVPLVPHNNLFLRVSNTNRLLIYLRNYNGFDRYYVVNMNTGEVELNEAQSSSINNATISPDGQMIAAPNLLYFKRSDGSWAKESKPHFNPNAIYYHPTEPLYSEMRSNATFYSTSTNAPVRKLYLQNGHIISSVDKATGYIVVYDYQYIYIYNPAGDKLLKKIHAFGNVQFFKDRLYANGHYLQLTF